MPSIAEILDLKRINIDYLFFDGATSAMTTLSEAKRNYLVNLSATIAATDRPDDGDIAFFLTEITTGLGIHQKDVAEIYEFTTGTLSRWTSGAQPPRESVRRFLLPIMVDILDYVIERFDLQKATGELVLPRPPAKPMRNAKPQTPAA